MGDEQLAAPGDLELVRRFVNTRDLELGTDLLATPADLGAWLRDEVVATDDAVMTAATAADLRRAVELREALRALLLANATGGGPPGEALDAIVAVGRRARLRVDGDLRLVPAARGVDGALARLLAIAIVARADGTWARLKACPGDSCQWALYDHTRSRTQTWCAAAKCGARTRSRAYRRRRRADAP
jgi:predicted RNA-binding Zn ribbon-like protein